MSSFGWFAQHMPMLGYGFTFFGFLVLGFIGAPLWLWSLAILASMWLLGASVVLWVPVVALLVIFNVPIFRQLVLSKSVMNLLVKLNVVPTISETERTAIEAGSTWVEGELFSGKPSFRRIMDQPYAKVGPKEQAFLDGPVDQVCAMIDDWSVYQKEDLPKDVWDYLKKEKFFGMIIPEEYGGLGFSALGHSEVINKLNTRSIPLAITVMVPNSLGPAELLLHYGTDQQKNYYLPRLAKGEEIPCFALTEPNAGSDAGAISSEAVVFRGDDGELYLRLNWNKRYITLAAVSTIIGLAVKLSDPENLLGKGSDLGITCVLVPAQTKGVVLGRRHNPMGVPFFNCPTRGEDVVVSVNQIIGGKEGAGQGWRMLMESLAAGRAISLPAQAAGGIKFVTRVTSAYAAIRRQFGVEIGKFEGIEEPLARIVGSAYAVEAMRVFTAGAVDSGVKPAVVSAIAKYNATEIGRRVVNDGMDVLGGAGISKGPRNTLAHGYIAAPIGITVEGANILTRSMIIFGQGAIRCHPFAYEEVKALMSNDLSAFDKAFWGHIGFVIRNGVRAVLLSLTRGYIAPTSGGPLWRYYQKLSWSSAAFAFMADVAMGSFGGGLKMREKLTGRYADILSWLYIATAVLRRYEAEKHTHDHLDVARYALDNAFVEIQRGFDGIFANLNVPVAGPIFKYLVGSWSRVNQLGRPPSDEASHVLSKRIMKPGSYRDLITEGIYLPSDATEAVGRYEHALKLIHDAEGVYKRIHSAVKQKLLPKGRPAALIEKALETGIISKEDVDVVRLAEVARNDAIQVDDFRVGANHERVHGTAEHDGEVTHEAALGTRL